MYDKQLQQHNLELNDGKSKLKDEQTDEQVDQKKLKQIFNLLREDTNDVPIELTEENVKLLLKKVSKNNQIEDNFK